MLGFRFYEELTEKNRKAEASLGNVVAVIHDNVCPDGSVECVASLYSTPDSPVCGSSASLKYLGSSCRRISEARAREMHPKLFEYLDT